MLTLGIIVCIVALAWYFYRPASGFRSPSEHLEDAYLDSAGMLEKIKYKFSGEDSRKEKLALFGLRNPKIVGNILDKKLNPVI